MNDKFFIELLETHQGLKKEYLKLDGYLGSNCNSFTLDWIKNNSQRLDPFIDSLLKSSFTYIDIRKLYAVSPSLHELWFLDIHFWHLIRAILYGRLGLKAILTSRKNNTSIEKMSSTFLLRRIILIENMLGTDNLLLSIEPQELSPKIFNLLVESVDNLDVDFRFLFSLIKGIVDLSKMDSLIKTWQYYSPCSINEGPIFDNPSSNNILEIVINAKNFQNKREYLRQNFNIVDYYFREELF